MFMQSSEVKSQALSIARRAVLPLNARMPARSKLPAGATTPGGQPIPSTTATQPSATGMVLQRERLHALIDARLPGAVWLHGPTGAGKTVLLRTWLQRDHSPSLWISADERLRDPAALFAAITAIAVAHGQGNVPVFSPEHRGDPLAFARGYFARLDQILPPQCAVVIDDAHHLSGATAPLLACAIDGFAGRRKLCFASQLMPDASFAPQLAGARLWIVGHKALAFTVDEARGLATRLGTVPPAFDALVDATDGWAAGLMLAMQFGASGGSGSGSDDPLEGVRTPLALLIAGQVLGGVGDDDRARLRLLAELPQVPVELADLDPDWQSTCARLQGLADRGLFVERLAADRRPMAGHGIAANVTRLPAGCWRLHDLFRSALRDTGSMGAPDVELGGRLVDDLLAMNRLDLAWPLAARLDTALLATVVSEHGSQALRDPHLLAMLQVAEPHADRTAPVIALWVARGLIGNDHVAALAACDEAWQGFTAAGDEVGASLSVSLALFVVFATIENVDAMAVWAKRFEAVRRASIETVAGGQDVAIRVAAEVVHDLLLGGRADATASESALQDRLMAQVAAQVLSANETVLAGSLLVAAMGRTTRFQEAELAILRVEGLMSYGQSAPHIRANWNIENGHHFTRMGSPDRARNRFGDALLIADENALLQPRIGALIGLARLELGLGDTPRAREHIEHLEALGPERLGRQRGWVLHLSARVEMLSGHPETALTRIDQAERLIFDAGFPVTVKVILDQDRIQMLYASGAVAESLALAKKVIAEVSVGDGRRIEVVGGLLEVHALWKDERARAMVLLADHLEAARTLNHTSFISLIPSVAAQVVAHGLALRIETEFLTQIVGLRNLLAPVDATSDWPWPVRIDVLKPFRIFKQGSALAFAGKAQQKPLELLKYLACTRDLMAETSTVASALWPDAEESAARKSLEVTVSRLRKLLEDDSLVIVKEGKVALDRQRVTTDAKELLETALEAETVIAGRHERLEVAEIGERLLDLFHELPLEHEEPTAWREGVRERYRAAFVRASRALIAYWNQTGDAARALALIEASLAREPLAESLYRMLIQVHLDAGDHTEAMRVYRQCRQMLSVLIGAQPAPETERLRNLIQL